MNSRLLGAPPLRVTARILLVCLGVAAAYVAARYIAEAGHIKRHQVESITFWFALGWLLRALIPAAAVHRVGIADHIEHAGATTGPVVGWRLWAALVGLVVALYSPALSVGFLSDDFILAQRAYDLQLGMVHADLFRPVPLAAWAAILRMGGGSGTLHLLNLLLHATSAYLVTLLTSRGRRTYEAITAGVFVAVLPIATEPVIWCSGIFDLSAAVFVLSAVAVARTYNGRLRSRVLLSSTCVLAVLCKETGLIAPFVVALDAVWRPPISRALRRDVIALAVLMTVVGSFRYAGGGSMVHAPITRFAVQRWAFGTIASLAVPFHDDVLQLANAAVITAVMITFAFFIATALRKVSARVAQRWLVQASMVMLGTLPTLPFFFVSTTLEGARYAYMAGAFWAMLISLVAFRSAGADRHVWRFLVIVLIAIDIAAIRVQLRPWSEAACLRDSVLRAAAEQASAHACGGVEISGLPDTVRGAYVFRNGFEFAFRSRFASAISGSRTCQFRWDPASGTLRSSAASAPQPEPVNTPVLGVNHR